jgi:hypothetical protein
MGYCLRRLCPRQPATATPRRHQSRRGGRLPRLQHRSAPPPLLDLQGPAMPLCPMVQAPCKHHDHGTLGVDSMWASSGHIGTEAALAVLSGA